jgi:hypothetical protein
MLFATLPLLRFCGFLKLVTLDHFMPHIEHTLQLQFLKPFCILANVTTNSQGRKRTIDSGAYIYIYIARIILFLLQQ